MADLQKESLQMTPPAGVAIIAPALIVQMRNTVVTERVAQRQSELKGLTNSGGGMRRRPV